MDQIVTNWLLGLFSMTIGFLLRVVWQSVKDLRANDKELTAKVNAIEVLVAGEYIKKDEFVRLSEAMFKKLDRIEEKLSRKEDRP